MAKEYKVITLKNGEKRYQFDVSLGYDAKGNRIRTTIRTKTIKEGRQKVAQLLLKEKNEIDKGIKFEDAYNLYIQDCERKGIAKNTLKNKKSVYQYFDVFALTHVYQIQEIDIQRWRNGLVERNSSAVANNVITNFNAFMNWCVKKKIISTNPFDHIDKVKYKPAEMGFWTIEDFNKFLDHVEKEEYRLFFQLIFYCGLRKSEALSLFYEDIDRNNNEIYVHRNMFYTNKKNYEITENMKTEKSKRIVPYPNWLEIPNGTGMIFKPALYRTSYIVFHKAIEDSGVPCIRIHDLRHSYVSMLIEKGVDMFTISKLVGHSNLQITSSVYAHLYDKKRKEVGEILNKIR